MAIHHMQREIRETVADLVYYERRLYDDEPRDLRRAAFRTIRAHVRRDGSMSGALAHLHRIAMSASLA